VADRTVSGAEAGKPLWRWPRRRIGGMNENARAAPRVGEPRGGGPNRRISAIASPRHRRLAEAGWAAQDAPIRQASEDWWGGAVETREPPDRSGRRQGVAARLGEAGERAHWLRAGTPSRASSRRRLDKSQGAITARLEGVGAGRQGAAGQQADTDG
jgi:hypothetical protein